MTAAAPSLAQRLNWLIDCATALGEHSALRSSSDETIAYWKGQTDAARAALQADRAGRDYLDEVIARLDEGIREVVGSTVMISKADACFIGRWLQTIPKPTDEAPPKTTGEAQ